MKKFYANGGTHPTRGIGHSPEARRKMSESRIGTRVILTDSARARLAEHCRRVLHAPAVMEKTIAINRLRVGKLSPSFGRAPAHTKKVWHEKQDGTRVCFRSTWEYAFAKWLTANGRDWEYEPVAFPVYYEIGGGFLKCGTYRPDFLSNGEWFEVKGRWLVESRMKFDSFVLSYPKEKITLIDRAWLKQRGIIKR